MDLDTKSATPGRRSGRAGTACLIACAAFPGAMMPVALEGQACLGFGGEGFAGPAVAVRHQESDSFRGVGGAVGFRLGELVAKGQALSFSSTDASNGHSGFGFARVNLAVTFPASGLPLCPTMTAGYERVPWPDSTFSSRSALMWGGGVAIGHGLNSTGSGLQVIPSAIVALEHSRIFEGEGSFLFASRQLSTSVRAGITFEFTDAFVRPEVALNTLAGGYVTGGVAVGWTF